MDCTYKTNWYGDAFTYIVGITATNKSFFVGFGFIHNEKQPACQGVLEDLRSIYNQLHLPAPRAIVTDKEKGLLNAIMEVFPTA